MKLVDENTNSTSSWYQPTPDAYDEMWSEENKPHSHWQYFIESLQSLGLDEMKRRRGEAQRILRENGVTYNVYGDPSGLNRPWELDPVPFLISSEEWATIEQGLIQRAELMNLLLTDIYGPRQLIKKGILPLELIYSHSGFLRPCDQVKLPGDHQLIVYAADMARGPDNRMWIVGDRSQAPSGAGYALENRMAMTRILPSLFRDCNVHRLAMFFHSLRSSLASIAPQQKDDLNIVVMTPGPRNETYFEHAYLAAYLGYTLVQGDDLSVSDGKVWLKSLGGLVPVDVILRRVDDNYCDPLELRPDSMLGVPGLLEVARRGNVAIANPLGSSVLENPGLIPFLPKIAQHFLGQDLRLPSVATWWCGQKKERDYVLANMDKLVIKPLYRHPSSRPLFGPMLSKKELANLKARILARPANYVGQQRVSFSSTPSLVNGSLEPRQSIIRSFMVARENDYQVMPGGLTRVAVEKDKYVVSNQTGGISKDTWVMASEPEKQVSLWLQPSPDQITSASISNIPSRTADNLYWVGRYAERAEDNARYLRIVIQKLLQAEKQTEKSEQRSIRNLLRSLTHVTTTYPGFVSDENKELLDHPNDELLAITLDTDRAGGLSNTVTALVQAAYGVRDRWSTDTWRVIDDITEEWLERSVKNNISLIVLQDMLDQLITSLVALSGLTNESMTREQGWRFLDIGRRIERSLMVISIIRTLAVPVYSPLVENAMLEATLVSNESLITYRRRYRSYLQLTTVLELLLFDDANPRSLIFQLNTMQQHIQKLPKEASSKNLTELQRLLLEASTQLLLNDAATLSQPDRDVPTHQSLDQLLARLSHLLGEMSQVITNSYFTAPQAPHQLVNTYGDSEE
ncbi:circularly permuted type 2 ATP-grasp protein [Kaarinaea lacus]